MRWCGGLAFIYMRWYTKLWTFRRLLRYSLGYVFSGFGVSSSLGWERFFTGQFWPFTWKTSPVGKGKVNKWEICKLKMTTIVVYVIVIQRIFPSWELAPTHSTIVIRELSIHLFSFFHEFGFSLFLTVFNPKHASSNFLLNCLVHNDCM